MEEQKFKRLTEIVRSKRASSTVLPSTVVTTEYVEDDHYSMVCLVTSTGLRPVLRRNPHQGLGE
jgi:hypothetical protein